MTLIDDRLPSEGEIWHPWTDLEESDSAMWGNVSNRKTWLDIAILFTGNADLYGEWMLNVLGEWKKSCEHNLSKSGDKRAWIGHAAVALAINCPEDIVREAWGHLSQEQQDAANKKASEAIEKWRLTNA
jgi:hypothetical protein